MQWLFTTARPSPPHLHRIEATLCSSLPLSIDVLQRLDARETCAERERRSRKLYRLVTALSLVLRASLVFFRALRAMPNIAPMACTCVTFRMMLANG